MNNTQKNFKKQMDKGLKELKKRNKDTYHNYLQRNHLDNSEVRLGEEKRNKVLKFIATPFKLIFKIIGAFIVLIIIVAFIKGIGNNPASNSKAISMDDFKKSATAIAYDNLARNADSLKNTKVNIKGIVVQSIDNSREIRINVASIDKNGVQTANQILFIQRKDNTGVLLQNDEVELWGIVNGYVNETLVTGQKISEPEITTYYLNIIKK